MTQENQNPEGSNPDTTWHDTEVAQLHADIKRYETLVGGNPNAEEYPATVFALGELTGRRKILNSYAAHVIVGSTAAADDRAIEELLNLNSGEQDTNIDKT